MDIYQQKNGCSKMTEQTVKSLWCGKSKLFVEEFENTIISYERYKELLEIPRNRKDPITHIDQVPEILNITF